MRDRIKGTLRGKIQSSASLFDKRGDRWGGKIVPPSNPRQPTELEEKADDLRRQHNIAPHYAGETEELIRQAHAKMVDPDMDQFTKATRAQPRPKYVDPAPSGKIEADITRRAANIRRCLHRDVTHKKPIKVEEKAFNPSGRPSFVSENSKWESRGGRNRKPDREGRVETAKFNAGVAEVIKGQPVISSEERAKRRARREHEHYLYVRYADGKEEEYTKKNVRFGKLSFDRKRKNKDVVYVELWSGMRLLHRWERSALDASRERNNAQKG